MIGFQKEKDLTLYLEKGEVKGWGERIEGKILNVTTRTVRPGRILIDPEPRSVCGIVIEHPALYVIQDVKEYMQRGGNFRGMYRGARVIILDTERLDREALLGYDLLKGVVDATPAERRPRPRDIERSQPVMYG